MLGLDEYPAALGPAQLGSRAWVRQGRLGVFEAFKKPAAAQELLLGAAARSDSKMEVFFDGLDPASQKQRARLADFDGRRAARIPGSDVELEDPVSVHEIQIAAGQAHSVLSAAHDFS